MTARQLLFFKYMFFSPIAKKPSNMHATKHLLLYIIFFHSEISPNEGLNALYYLRKRSTLN